MGRAVNSSFAVTFFVDHLAKTKRQRTMTMEELADLIRTTTARRKEDLPWLKLARFGNAITTKGSLRSDRNVIGETGIEGDYDGEVIPFETAVEKVEKAGLRAILYTSPSYTPEKPRWRILCPYSRELPGARARMLARVNGLLGGILQSESWTLSQSYYYGSVDKNPHHHRVIIVDGLPLDEVDELDLIGIGKPGTTPATNGGGNGQYSFGPVDEKALLEEIRTGASYHTAAIRLIGSWALRGMAMLEARDRIVAAFEDTFPPDRDERWQTRVNEIPRLLEHVYGKEAQKRDSSTGHSSPNGHDKQERPAAVITPQNGDAFAMQKIDWLWKGWIARGKFHLLAGAKSAGKSTIVFDLLANLTAVGGKWPDGNPAPLGDVLMWSGEDGIEDTILPRFVAAGGDRKRIYPIKDVISNGAARPFDPSTDIPALIKMAETLPNLVAIGIDPVVLAIPSKADSHKNTETRRGLQPLVDLAERRNAALIGITHFTKGTSGLDPIERVTGSIAFAALARVVLGVRQTTTAASGDWCALHPISGPAAAASNTLCFKLLSPGTTSQPSESTGALSSRVRQWSC